MCIHVGVEAYWNSTDSNLCKRYRFKSWFSWVLFPSQNVRSVTVPLSSVMIWRNFWSETRWYVSHDYFNIYEWVAIPFHVAWSDCIMDSSRTHDAVIVLAHPNECCDANDLMCCQLHVFQYLYTVLSFPCAFYNMFLITIKYTCLVLSQSL